MLRRSRPLVLAVVLPLLSCATASVPFHQTTGLPLMDQEWHADALGRVEGTFEECGVAVRKAGAGWALGHGMKQERTASGTALGVRSGVFRASSAKENGVFELRYTYAYDRRTVKVGLGFVAAGGAEPAKGQADALRARYAVDDLSEAVRQALRCDDPAGAP